MSDAIREWLAVVISVVALGISLRVDRRQRRLHDKQLAQMDRDDRERLMAAVTATLNRTDSWAGSGTHYEIVITNQGPAEAHDVDISFLGSKSPLPVTEAANKLPITTLPANTGVRLIAAVSFGCAPPFPVVLKWRDGLGQQQQKALLT